MTYSHPRHYHILDPMITIACPQNVLKHDLQKMQINRNYNQDDEIIRNFIYHANVS